VSLFNTFILFLRRLKSAQFSPVKQEPLEGDRDEGIPGARLNVSSYESGNPEST
jgi:hypothetical protein